MRRNEEKVYRIVCKMISGKTGEDPADVLMRIAKRAEQLRELRGNWYPLSWLLLGYSEALAIHPMVPLACPDCKKRADTKTLATPRGR